MSEKTTSHVEHNVKEPYIVPGSLETEGYEVVRLPSENPNIVKEYKLHKPGTMLEPGRW